MMIKRPEPTRPADDAAYAIAQTMLGLGHGALSYLAEDGMPGISRVALGHDSNGYPLTFVSALAPHFAGLQGNPACALMLGEPGAKGDPLTHPRLMMRAMAEFAAQNERPALRDLWLTQHPKAKLYIDFPDFAFVRLRPVSAVLNGGFGKAFTFGAENLRLAQV